jgi:hypothetical protein
MLTQKAAIRAVPGRLLRLHDGGIRLPDLICLLQEL